MGFDTKFGGDDNNSTKAPKSKTSGTISGPVTYLTLEEYADPSKYKKVACRTMRGDYDKDGNLIGYHFGGFDPGHVKHLAELKRKKKEQ